MSELKLSIKMLGNPELVGDGEELKLNVRGFRRKKTGDYDHYKMTLTLPRFFIRSLAQQIASMHERDRERLRSELQRIEVEVSAIKEPEARK